MKILIIGYSKFVQNRILPVVRDHRDISSVDIASLTRADRAMAAQISGTVFNDYEDALSRSKADIVYVSTVNSDHYALVRSCLQSGRHVIVDKPAFTSLEDAQAMCEIAARSGLCIAESTIYSYHRQVDEVKAVFRRAGSSPARLIAVFSVPPLDPGNFRYKASLGGGAMFDLGPYAVSVGRVFFDEEPIEITGRVCAQSGTGHDSVDISFSMLAVYPNGRSMVGHFGFDTEYRNHIEVIGPGVAVSLERVFTTPPDMENRLYIQQKNERSTVTVAPCDNFRVFLDAVTAAIKAGDTGVFAHNLLSDARALHCLRASASEDQKCR